MVGSWGATDGGRVYLESSAPERRAEPPGTLKDGVFKKEGLVTFQVMYCLFPITKRQSRAPPPFLAQFTSHHRL